VFFCACRLDLEWSVVSFSQSHYVVCEDAGTLAVRIVRAGALDHLSSIAVRIRSMSAKETSDFAAKSDSVVQFQPGQRTDWIYALLLCSYTLDVFIGLRCKQSAVSFALVSID